MFCTRCQNELPDCTCDDRAERIEALNDIDGFETNRCPECAENAQDCRCDDGE